MPNINDVVRHVILRILVEQESLVDDLASARAKLKKFEQDERDANKRRAKDAETVTNALRIQREEAERTAQALGRSYKNASDSAAKTTESLKEGTRELREQAKAVNEQALNEARLAGIHQRNEQAKLDATSKRAAKERADASSLAALLAKHADEELLRQQKIRAEKAKTSAVASISRSQVQTADARRRQSYAQTQGQELRTADVEDAVSVAHDRRRVQAQHEVVTSRQRETLLARQIEQIEQRIADTAARRARSEELSQQRLRQRRGLLGAAAQVVRTAQDPITAFAEGGTDQRDSRLRTAAKAYDEVRQATVRAREAAQQYSRLQVFGLILLEAARASRLFDGIRAATIRAREAVKDYNRLKLNVPEVGRFEREAARSARAMQDFRRVTEEGRATAERFSRVQMFKTFVADTKRGESAIRAFFQSFKRGEGESVAVLTNIQARFKAMIAEVRNTDAGGLGDRISRSFNDIGQTMANVSGSVVKSMLHWRFWILALIAAFGPLVASIGAVGAVALGLASNIISLAGSLAALPGLIGAAVAGFGALAVVMAPLSKVFEAFSAAEAASVSTTEDAADAADKLARAERRLRDAQQESYRASRDVPRSLRDLANARKEATRDIEDYRTALERLRWEEEGAALGVESAEAAYRRALADPTKSNLNRKQARHDLQGAIYDQQDQDTENARLKEDAADAIARGVEGSDKVIDAQDRLQDAYDRVTDAADELTDATNDLSEAQKDVEAGSNAARKAAEKLEALLGELSPSTQIVVRAILGLKDAWKLLQDDLSEAIFAPLADDTGKFATVLDSLRAYLTPAAEALGYLAEQALSLFTNPDWQAFFSSQGKESDSLIRTLGEAALLAADGFKEMVIAARPFTRGIADSIKDIAGSFKEWFEDPENKKAFASFLEVTSVRLGEIGTIVKNVAIGIMGFWKALNPNEQNQGQEDFTTWLNGGLIKASERFAELGRMASDPNGGFQKWLTDVKPLIVAVAGFLGDLGRMFGELFSDPKNIAEAVAIFEALSNDVLPRVTEFFKLLSESGFISGLVTAIGNLLTIINKLFEYFGSPLLSGFATTLETVIGWLAAFATGADTILTVLGPLGSAIKGIAYAIGVLLVASLVASVLHLGALVKGAFALRAALKSGGLTGLLDSAKDRITGRDTGESAARRDAQRANKDRPDGTPKADIDRTNTGGILPTLYRIEKYTQIIARNSARWGGGTTGGGSDGGRNRNTGPTPRPTGGGGTARTTARTATGGVSTVLLDGDDDDDDRRRRRGRATIPDLTSGSIQDAVSPGATRRRRQVTIPDVDPTGRAQPSTITNAVTRSRDYQPDERTRQRQEARAQQRSIRERTTIVPGTGTISSITDRPRHLGFDTLENASSRRRDFGITSTGSLSTATRPARPSQRQLGTTVLEGDILPADRSTSARRRRTTSTDLTPHTGLPWRYLDDDQFALDGRRQLPGGVSATSVGSSRRTATLGGLDDIPALSRRTASTELPAARIRPALPAGYVPAPRGAGGRFRPVDDTEARPTPQRGSGGQFASADKPDPPRLLRAGTDYSVYTGSDGRPLTETGEKPRKKRYADVPHEAVEHVRRGGFGSRLVSFLKPPDNDEGSFDTGRVRERFSRRARTLDEPIDDNDDSDTRRRGGGGRLGRLGMGLAKGVGAGVVGLALSGAMALGGDYLVNKFVKDKDDASSVQRGLGAVANGAGIGATIGSIIPGVGTVVGGAVGGAIGGIFSLFKDKNLRDFVSEKLANIGESIVDGLKDAGRAVKDFFTETIPEFAADAWQSVKGVLWDPFATFITESIPNFFTSSIPSWFATVNDWIESKIREPLRSFIFDSIPAFFTETIPGWFSSVNSWIEEHIRVPIRSFIFESIPAFFTETIPGWFASVGQWFSKQVIDPVVNLFTRLKDALTLAFTDPLQFAENVAGNARQFLGFHSGGEIPGMFQGVLDTMPVMTTVGEFVVRRSKVQQPYGKQFLTDYNEGRIDPAQFYSGLTSTTAPPVMSIVPPDAGARTGQVPSVVNNQVDNSLSYGDIIIHNPIRERSDHSLRRQLQIQAMRHRM